jgi:hypothetical protein
MDEGDEYHPRDEGNSGLQIKRFFKHLGHKHWGFIMYRCTYGDDDAWAKFMTILHKCVRESLEECGTEEFMDSFDCTVREDPSVLDGASKALVRQRFLEWRASSDAEAERISSDSQPILVQGYASTPRYGYCIHVDEEALQSVLRARHPDTDGYVNLIQADWAVPDEEEQEKIRQEFQTDDALEEGEEPIEGCRMYDVGWLKIHLGAVMPSAYAKLHGGDWDLSYARPPDISMWW